MSDEITVRVDITVTDENITDLLDVAMGTWEWWDDFHLDGQSVEIFLRNPDTGEDDGMKRINTHSLKVSLANHAVEEGAFETENGGLVVDMGQYDALRADDFLQNAVFGKPIYG